MTGTKLDRPQFQKMLDDCKDGKIDMVITKSISRFARNTVTTLTYVRELRQQGIAVYFEKENINTLSGDGELMLTVLSSFAQEESYNVSENCKWRIRKRFENGELVNLRFMYGYKITRGKIEIEPEEAEIVRMIFTDFLSGMGSSLISKKLNDMNIPSLTGKKWWDNRILKMLKNEKYMGHALLQKTHVADHLTKSQKANKGELPMYYATNSHPGIISKEIFDAVQEEITRKAVKNNVKQSNQNRYPFSAKIVCTNCGKHYKRRTLHASKPYRRVFWNCSTYLRLGKDVCFTKQVPEDILYKVTTKALGLNEFDEVIFNKEIKLIQISEFNKLKFIFNNGLEKVCEWSDSNEC